MNLISRGLKTYYLDLILILIIPLIALRGFLFESGYYFYSDQGWPLSNYIYPTGILSFNSLTGFSFSRLIIDWPYYLTTLFTDNVMVSERAFIYYTFVLYLFFAYVFATMVTSKFLQTNNRYETIAVKFIIILFIFSNFTALNLINDGGSFSDNLNIIFIAIILLSFISWRNMKMAFLLSSILLTVSILVEPDYTTFYIISIIVGSIIAGLINKDFLYRFKYAILTIISAIIPVAFVILGLVLTSSNGTTITAVGALRSYNYGTISFFSANIKPLYPLILIGHFWSTIVYAPPNILFNAAKISTVKSLMSPSQLLLPNGFITDIWLFTVIMIPVISLISIFFKKTRKVVFPVIILFTIFYLMSLVYYIMPLFDLEMYISQIPLVGGSIGTTLALPGHIINVIASMYYILFSITLVNLINLDFHVDIKSSKDKINITVSIIKDRITNVTVKKYFKNNKFRICIILFMLFIVIFSGWQAFDGTFYPARAPDTVNGNKVANIGGYTPLNINNSVVSAYDFISGQKTNFDILWIGGPAFSNRGYAPPHPEACIPDLKYITSNNLGKDFYYNLLYSDVKYIVISNQDIQKNPINIEENTFSDTGFTNFTNAQNFLQNISGLKEIYNRYHVEIFEINNFSSIYRSNLLLNYEGNSVYEGVLPYLFKTLGYNISITDGNKYGLPVNFNNNSKQVSIDTPKHLSTLIGATNASYFNLSSNKPISGFGHNNGVAMPDNFTLTLWVNNETYYSYNNRTINITGNALQNGVSVSYNGSFTGGAGGFFLKGNLNDSTVVTLNLTFCAKASTKSTDRVLFMGESKSNIYADNIESWRDFNVSNTYKKYTLSYTFPDTEKFVDFRLFDYTNGAFYIKNLSTKYMSYPSIIERTTLPFGNFVSLSNTLLKGSNENAFIYMDNTTMNNYQWINFNFGKGLHLTGLSQIAALILINNTSLLNSKNASIIVSIYPSSREYEAIYLDKHYGSIPGIYGNSIFIINRNVSSLSGIKIISKGKIIMDVFYLFIITYIVTLSSFLLKIYRRNKIRIVN